MDYTKYLAKIDVPGDALLEDWRWLIGPTFQLWHVTVVGDAFILEPSDGSVHFLDIISGKLERIADNESAFETKIKSSDNAEKWLMTEVVDGQASLGIRPGKNECLSFIIPPILGGKLDPDNIETCNVLVHFSISGQIHHQVKDLPPGAKIGNINIVEPNASKRRWWKFW